MKNVKRERKKKQQQRKKKGDEEYDYEEEGYYWYDAHFSFFRRAWGYDFDEDANMTITTPTGARPPRHHEHGSVEKISNEDMIIEIIKLLVATKSACFAV